MLALPELQRRFAAAILREDATELAEAVIADGLAPAARVQVYWNHVFSSLTEALEATYPIVCRLVDRRFFGFAADRFIRGHPPDGPCLFEYGAAFPEFLATFPACAAYPYLADVARLEWAMNVALHAEDAPTIEPAALGCVSAEDVGRLLLRLDPAAAWLQSAWPVDRIWQAHQPATDPTAAVDLSEGPVRLEIRRHGEVVGFRRLEPAAFAFRATLARGGTLEIAVAGAMAEDARFDPTGALRALLGDTLLTGFTLEADGGDPRR